MKVWIGKPKEWFGPYQLAEFICFWAKVKTEDSILETPQWVHDFGEWLTYGSVEKEEQIGSITSLNAERPTTILYKFLLWIDKVKNKIPSQYIKLDPWDTWNADYTLSLIILQMLRQLKDTKHGSPLVDEEDAPLSFDNDTEEELIHSRWNWVLDEMIYAFEHIVDSSWEDNYYSGTFDSQFIKLDNGSSQLKEGPNSTFHCDYEGLEKESKRIDNGLRLFGKYFRNLWD